MYRIEKYNDAYLKTWDDYVDKSLNGTFLFRRGFMEYHSDRFEDFSLMVFDSQKLISVLPANRVGNEFHSHQGLTYGGLIIAENFGAEKTEAIFDAVLSFLKEENINLLRIKQVIPIYHRQPVNEMDYILFKKGAKLYRRDMNLAVDYSQELSISKSKLKHFRRVSSLGLEIRKDNNFRLFWDEVLIPRLQDRHGVKPVHTADEIELLHNRFPENILQYNAYFEERIVAGITLFCFDNVLKSQYGATTAEGEKLRALDYLFITLIDSFKDKKHYFDMGTPNENEGKTYNKGLLKQKEELGCSVYTQDFYELSI